MDIVPVIAPDGTIILVNPADDTWVDAEENAMLAGMQQFPTDQLPPGAVRRRRYACTRKALSQRPPENLTQLAGLFLVHTVDLEGVATAPSATQGWSICAHLAGELRTGAWVRELETGRMLVVVHAHGKHVWTCPRDRLLFSLPKPWQHCSLGWAIWRYRYACYSGKALDMLVGALLSLIVTKIFSC